MRANYMANKPPKKPLEAIESRKNIAPYIIMAIMAGLSIGISATYIYMSQTVPLRADLKESQNLCSDLLKKMTIMLVKSIS